MLNVKVHYSKWQCLLCKRTFTSKFCYALHCKNVHSKDAGDRFDEIGDRPICNLNEKQEDKNEPEFHALPDESGQNGTEKEVDGSQKDEVKLHSCLVCKKHFSSLTRLSSHKRLHSSTRRTRKPPKKDNIPKIACSIDQTSKEEVLENYQEETQVTDDGSAKQIFPDEIKQNKDDHLYGQEPAEVDSQQKKESDLPKSLDMNLMKIEIDQETSLNEADGNEKVYSKTGSVMVNTFSRKRGRPKKDQPKESIADSVNVEFEEKIMEQTLVFPEIPAEVKSGKKRSGARKKSRECEVCHKVFANRSSLREHLRMHTGEKPYICSICEKGFIRMGHLRQHMCSHTGLWPFKCGACGKGFMNPSRVTRHMRVHNDERPCVCDKCNETFKEPHHLARHMHLHSGVKPFKCPVCEDRYFIQAGNLKIHMKTHEREMTESNLTIGEVSHEVSLISTSQVAESGTTTITQENQAAIEGLLLASDARGKDQGRRMKDECSSDSAARATPTNADMENSCSVAIVTDVDDPTIKDGAVTAVKQDAVTIEVDAEVIDGSTEEVEQDVETIEQGVVGSQIVLQIVPGVDHDLQVQGFQALSSLDPELLRHFATSVAQELSQSQ